jgi:hypothetical protein
MLRPTVSWPVCLGVKHPSGAYDEIFINVRQLRVFWCGPVSLTREWVCRLQFLPGLASEFILGSESRGNHDHILLSDSRLPQPGGPGPRIYIPQEQCGPFITPGTGFLFVASYDSQGFAGSIRPRLHKGFSWLSSESESESLYDWRFTANHFVLAPSPMRLTARILFLIWTPAVIVLI